MVLSRDDWFQIPFSLLWLGFVLAFLVGSSGSGADGFRLGAVPFLVAGLYMVVGRFFTKRWDRRTTSYFITQWRAVVVRRGGQRIQDAAVASMHMRSRRSRDHRHGSITWSFGEESDAKIGDSRSGSLIDPDLLVAGCIWPVLTLTTRHRIRFLDVVDFDNLLEAVNQMD